MKTMTFIAQGLRSYDNPATRIPVCVCMDISGSMNEKIVGSDRTSLDELKDGVQKFLADIVSDEQACYAAEICFITFGGDGAQLYQDFAFADQCKNIADLTAGGHTPTGEAVNLALSTLAARKEYYKQHGIEYYQPWLVLMTDGTPINTDPTAYNNAIRNVAQLLRDRKLTVFPMGIGDKANLKELAKLSPERTPIRFDNTNFSLFLRFIGQTVVDMAKGDDGGNTVLNAGLLKDAHFDGGKIKGWDQLYT